MSWPLSPWHLPTSPLFHYCGLMAIVRHRLDAPLRETKPITGRAGWDAAAGARDAGRMRQTKPNRGSRYSVVGSRLEDRGADRAKRTQFGAGGRQRPPGHDRAKQSQFRPRVRRVQVVGRKGVMVYRTCNRLRKNKAKTGQAGASGQVRSRIWGDFAGEWNVQNEPNWVRKMSGGDAQPTKSREGGRATSPRCPASGNEANCGRGRRSVNTGQMCDIASMPRFGKRTQFGPAWAGFGRSYDAKQTQSRAARRTSGGGLCKTKPIPALTTEQDASFSFIDPATSGRVCGSVTWGGPLRRSCVLARRLLASGTLAL